MFKSQDRLRSIMIGCVIACLFGVVCAPLVLADLDVNAVDGQVLIDDDPAPSGTRIRLVNAVTGHVVITSVDGEYVPSFMRGQGRYNTGDVAEFDTGNAIIVSVDDQHVLGESSAILLPGTTTIDLDAHTDLPPSIRTIPWQSGFEDIPWELDLDPYLSDPDTPLSRLGVSVSNRYVSVRGHVLTFNYPEGVLEDSVTIYVRDSSSSVVSRVGVSITPVDDPPRIAEIPTIALMEGRNATIDLSHYVFDPDDDQGDLLWEVHGGRLVSSSMEGSRLTLSAAMSRYGMDSLQLVVSDSAGLWDNGTLTVKVEVNLTALIEFYQGQISDLSKKVAQLDSQVAHLAEENLNLSVRMEGLLEELSQLKGEKEDLGRDLRDVQNDASQLLGKLKEAETQSGLDAQTIAGLQQERTNLSSQMATLKRTLETTTSSYLGLVSQIEVSRQESETLIAALKEQLAEVESALLFSESNDGLKGEIIADLTVQRTQLQSIIQGKGEEISGLEELASALMAQIDKLKSENRAAEESLKEVTRSLEAIRRQAQDHPPQKDETASGDLPKADEGPSSPLVQRLTGIENMVVKAIHLARDGGGLFLMGMRSTIGFILVAMVAFVYAASILSRTSWNPRQSKRPRNGSDMAPPCPREESFIDHP